MWKILAPTPTFLSFCFFKISLVISQKLDKKSGFHRGFLGQNKKL
jgi:hypothetical protein